jgi:CheY-like chemotaxis protein
MPNVLIIDDDADVGRGHQRLLERAGFDVTTVENALAALGELQLRAFDVILLDIRMPFLQGTGLYDELTAIYPQFTKRVVFVTGFAGDPGTRAFLRDAGRPVLMKPVEFEDLVSAVQRVAGETSARQGAARPVRVLVVDDDGAVRTTVRRTLMSAGHDVVEAPDGAAALKVLGAAPPVDLLLTDIYMPQMDGIELTIRARMAGRPLPVIAMSGGGYMKREDVLDTARKIGAMRTLAKPFTPQELLATVEDVLNWSG